MQFLLRSRCVISYFVVCNIFPEILSKLECIPRVIFALEPTSRLVRVFVLLPNITAYRQGLQAKDFPLAYESKQQPTDRNCTVSSKGGVSLGVASEAKIEVVFTRAPVYENTVFKSLLSMVYVVQTVPPITSIILASILYSKY